MNRREFSGAVAALLATCQSSALAEGMGQLQRREIPGTGDFLPVIGLGNSAAFRERDLQTAAATLRLLHNYGGAYVDCIGDSRLVVAEVAASLGLSSELFLGTYFSDFDDREARNEAAQILEQSGKSQLDLMQTYAERAAPYWSRFQAWKDEGLTRYIGIARHQSQYYDSMLELMATDTVDFLQVNYSLLETEAEDRVLPMAMDKGVAVTINRPFVNGRYFDVVRGQTLPAWAAEFDCRSWAQFSLKFILSHPAVNCILTETANPRHLEDNLGGDVGALPDPAMRRRMLAHIREITS